MGAARHSLEQFISRAIAGPTYSRHHDHRQFCIVVHSPGVHNILMLESRSYNRYLYRMQCNVIIYKCIMCLIIERPIRNGYCCSFIYYTCRWTNQSISVDRFANHSSFVVVPQFVSQTLLKHTHTHPSIRAHNLNRIDYEQ